MKQVTQRPKDGQIAVHDVPVPVLEPGSVLVATRYSLLSAGTERSKVELGGKSLLQKARARPDLVRKVVDRARVEGVRAAVGAAQERLAALAPLGYSASGIVLRVGTGVEGIAPGDPVACGGQWANHAEVLAVPRNLVAKVPTGVPLDSAAYATVGAIALHGVRQAEAAVGESVGVIGLGLVGQLAVRILAAAGCRAIGIDPDPAAVELATGGGAQAFDRATPGLEATVRAASGGIGLDAVLVCAAARSADPVELAAQLARDRGRIVIVGDVLVSADRALLYEKELELRLSRSSGPGRYDRDYEERGRDLAPGYVRWTEGRNMQAFLELVATRRLDPAQLTTHRFPVERAPEAYAVLSGGTNGGGRPFGVLLEYTYEEPTEETPPPIRVTRPAREGAVRIGLIGAGSFARGTLLPAFKAGGAELVAVATSSGLSARDVASRFGFARTAASAEEVLTADDVEAVVIATRHSSHGRFAAAALAAGKAVFVEKPLALAEDEVDEVERALAAGGVLMVGFNRRFAPLTERLRAEIAGATDIVLSARVNAGPLPPDHWLHDPEDGGGRLLGEGCHFVDLLAELGGAPAVSAHAVAIPPADRALEASDAIVGTLRLANGAVASLVYTGLGDPRLPKERIEAFGGGLAAVLEDFRRLELFRDGKRTVVKGRQDKGHQAQIARFLAAAAGQVEAPPVETYLASTRATLALAESLRTGLPVVLS